jgi:hypothetical protein
MKSPISTFVLADRFTQNFVWGLFQLLTYHNMMCKQQQVRLMHSPEIALS